MTSGEDTGHKQEQKLCVIDKASPPLSAGSYSMKVTQSPKHKGTTQQPFEAGLEFRVSAPRFEIGPDTIYSMYPPANGKDDYSNCLPHIVLNRRTLPWERHIDASDDSDAPPPWLALITLGEDEFTLEQDELSEKCTLGIKDISEKNEKIVCPDIKDEDGDLANGKKCLCLDLPIETFRTSLPSKEQLHLFAHVRCVQISDKEDENNTRLPRATANIPRDGINDTEDENKDEKAWFSVIIGKRPPCGNKRHGVFLVSLEGHSKRLNDEEKKSQKVRVVVLTSWSFDNRRGPGSFNTLVSNLNCSALSLSVDVKSETTGDAVPWVESTLKNGYVPLRYRTQDGSSCVSWYRGPLVPHLPFIPSKNTIYTRAEEAVPDVVVPGMPDVSRAAAWQLGRLLALQNRQFMQALVRLRSSRKVRAAGFDEALRLRLPGAGTNQLWSQQVKEFLKYASGKGSSSDESKATSSDSPKLSEKDFSKEIVEWLGRLHMLYGVPLHYLVPHPQTLPPESLSVFFVDPKWIGALLDGALSICRPPKNRLWLDKVMARNFYDAQWWLDNSVQGNFSSADVQVNHDAQSDSNGRLDSSLMTGFLLRSALVSGWRGIHLSVYGDKGKKLQALRLERIGESLLLGIYAGKLARIVMTQPSQGLHFSLEKLKGDSNASTDGLLKKLEQTSNSIDVARELLARPVQWTLNLNDEVENS